tara:strand:+ start:57 stop:794 length:738 start_codon:yes stop_codon:yes gene_type:complete
MVGPVELPSQVPTGRVYGMQRYNGQHIMTDSAKITGSIAAVGKLTKSVITDVQARPDYSGSQTLKVLASQLRVFSQDVLNNETSGTTESYQALRKQASGQIIPEIHKLNDANIEMANLGQLNTKRLVKPSVLQSENAILQNYLNALEAMIALIGAPQTSSASTSTSTSSSTSSGSPSSATKPAQTSSDPQKDTTKPSETAKPSAAESVMAPPISGQVFKGTPTFKDVQTYQQLVSASALSVSGDQ